MCLLYMQILNALNEVSSFCLRSVLTAIFKWRDMQVRSSHQSHCVKCTTTIYCRLNNAVTLAPGLMFLASKL